MANPISLQFYTLRDLAAQDFVGTLAEVAKIGYGAVELAGYGNMSASALRAELDRLGLKASGAHTPIERLEKDLDRVLEELQILGAKYVICPWLAPDRRPGADGYRALGATLNTVGEKAKAAGLQFAYHHHDFELQRFGESTGLHLMLAESDPELVKVEVDIYWAAFAGFDPVTLLKEFGSRAPLIHLKDMTPAPERTFAEVGNGTLDIPGVLATADEIGAEWLIVEQDRCQRPPLESITLSRAYLKNLGR